MLQKSKSRQSALIKYIVIVPLILAMLVQVSWAQNAVDNEGKRNFTLVISKFGNGKGLYSVMVKDSTKLTSNEMKFIKELRDDKSLEINDIVEDVKNNGGNEKNEGGLAMILMMRLKESVGELAEKYNIKAFTFEELKEMQKKDPSYAGARINSSEVVQKEEVVDIPYAVIENVPTYPGCENLEGNDAQKVCMSNNVSKYVNRNFNMNIAKDLGLTGVNRIFVSFRINKTGQVDNVRVRAPHEALEEEARRVIYNLPQMKPGTQGGENVGVLYSLPITFQIAK